MGSFINKLFGNWNSLDCEKVKQKAMLPNDIECCLNCHTGNKNAHIATITLHTPGAIRVKVCCEVAAYFDAKAVLN